MSDLVRLAARNNAEWCDAVCRNWGRPGEFRPNVWLNRHPAPPFYPNAVTLTPDDDRSQRATLEALANELGTGFAVKDSFATLDLAPIGFAPLFSASWIARLPGNPVPAGDYNGLDWRIVSTPQAFDAWQSGWSGDASPPSPFAPTLLEDPVITLIGGWRGDTIVAGAALNRSASTMGWSNVFVPDKAARECRAGALRFALSLAGNLPLLGYERGEALAQFLSLGFTACGPLTIWGR